MNFQQVKNVITGCLGGTFTGKVVVRISDGKIVACDVGEVGKGISPLTVSEAMKRVVNVPEPRKKPPEVLEAEIEVERANEAYDAARVAWIEASDRLQTEERLAFAMAAGGNAVFDDYGRPASPEVLKARTSWEEAEREMESRSEELRRARVRATNLTKHHEALQEVS